MQKRLDYYKTDPKAIAGMLELEKYVVGSGLEKSLYELEKLRR